MTNIIAPIQPKDREVFMDVLRGFAILGILIANLTAGGLGWGPNGIEKGTYLLPELDKQLLFYYSMFIDGKFYSIFSLLFGWGIALQIQRGINNGIDAVPMVKRRLMFMMLLGFVHLIIYVGDIVLFYAMLGFLLLPLRKFSNKTLIITGAILILSPIILYAAKMHWPVLNKPSELLNQTGDKLWDKWLGIHSEAEYLAWIKKAGWWGQFQENVIGIFYRYGNLFFISRISKVFGMFLIGYAIGRSNFYKNILQNKKIIYWAIWLGLLIGLPANYILAYYESNFNIDYYQLKPNGLYKTIAYAAGVAPLALVYTGACMLWFQTDAGKKIMSVFAPVGKMAFSNYMMHSLVCHFIFLSQGLDYGGKVGTFYLTVFAFTLFIVQIICSTIWLKHFNYGPVEWVWRSLTYGKFQSFKNNWANK